VLFFIAISICSCKHSNPAGSDHPAIINKIIDSANHLADRKGTDSAFSYLDVQYALIPDPGTGDQWKKYYFKQKECLKIARLNNDKNQLALASTYADSMLQVIKNNHAEKAYKNELSIADFSKGDALFDAERYQEAYKFFFEGKLLADKSGNQCSHAFFDSRFALLNYKEAKYRQAVSLFLEAYHDDLGCTMNFETFAATQGALDNAGLSYDHLGMADSAITCYLNVLRYIDQNANRFPYKTRFLNDARGVTYGYLGMTYQQRGKVEEAEKWYKKSILLNNNAGNERANTQIIQLKLARMYLETGHIPESDSLIKAIRASLDTLHNDRAELDWQKLKWNYLNATRQPQKANPYLLTYLKLKDSADAKERKLAVADAGSSFQHIQQDYELAILKKENQLRSLSLILTLGFSFMALFIIFLVWRGWRISKKSNRELTMLNLQIEERNLYLQKALSALEQSQEENTKMMQIVAHDLRNPIGGITSIASMMLDEKNRSEDDQMMLELIKTSGQNSLELVSDLLQVHTRVEDLKKEPVDLSRMLHYCADLLHFKAEAKKQQIELYAESFMIPVSREKMWRVISNLIANAIKFSPSGAIIQVEMTVNTNAVLIAVKDHGIGIPDEMKDKIFDMFTEAKRPGTAGEQPFGLGLAISKQIVEAHGGKIWFVSKPKQGTVFYVELPVAS